MLCFEINSESPHIALPDEKIAGGRVRFDYIEENQRLHALEVVPTQQVRCQIEQFRPSGAIWKYIAWPIDLLLQYTDGRAIWDNCPVPEVWGTFRNSLSIAFNLAQSEQQWRQISQCSSIRLITPEQRLSVHLDRVSPRFMPGRFVWASVDAALEVLGGLCWAVVSSPTPRSAMPYLSLGHR